MTAMERLRAHLATLPADYPITSGRLARALALPQHVVSTYLKRLAAAGAIQAHAAAPAQAVGGRRAVIYRAVR